MHDVPAVPAEPAAPAVLFEQVSMTKDRPARRRAGWASRALRWVEARTGYTRAQLSLGTQVGRAVKDRSREQANLLL